MFLKILATFSLLLGFAFSQTVLVRTGNYEDKERIVFQLERQTDYKVFTLENPKRIVVDIMEDVRVSLPKGMEARVGKHPWGTRIVLERDFDGVKAFSLQSPFRIVLDVYHKRSVVAKRGDDEELLEIIDPSFIRVLKYMERGKEEERVISQIRKGRMITQRRVIVIDPGHGGHDPGAIGFAGIKEKDVVLAIGKKLARLLEEDGRFRVIMTRQDDTFIPLQERAK